MIDRNKEIEGPCDTHPIDWDKVLVDPTCLFHGKKWSEHEGGRCLYCCLCFKTLTLEECSYLPDGTQQDVCVECAEAELRSVIYFLNEARKALDLMALDLAPDGRSPITVVKEYLSKAGKELAK